MTPLDTMMVAICCLALGYGALHDIAVRTIPNALCVCIGVLGAIASLRMHHLVGTLIAAAVVFLAGVCAWRARWLGGGDVKLLAAVSLWFRPAWDPALLLTTAISGGVLACAYLLLGRIVPIVHQPRPRSFTRRVVRVELHRARRRGAIPYAVAIATAAIICLVQE